MLFKIEFELCALPFLIVLGLYFFFKNKLSHNSNYLYGACLLTAFVNITLDIITSYTISYPYSLPLLPNILLNVLFYSTNIFLPAALMLYTMSITDYLCRKNKAKVLVLLVPLALSIIMIISTVFNGFTFRFDENRNYIRGTGYIILYMVMLFYMFSAEFIIIKLRRRLSKIQFLTINSFTALLLIAALVQYINKSALLTGVAITLSLLMMYLTFQNPDDFKDKLTGFYGRSAFINIMDGILQRGRPCGIIIVDLNDFKLINNLFGLVGGDSLIIGISEFLASVTSNKRVFRIGGDRFAVVSLAPDKTEALSDLIRSRFNGTWNISGSFIKILCGIINIPVTDYVSDSEGVIQIIEDSIAFAKETGKGYGITVDQTVYEKIQHRKLVEASVRNAIKNDLFQIYLQPIYSVKKDCVVAAEVLLRLYDTKLGFIPAEEFISVAERTGLINSVGRIAFEKACIFISKMNPKAYGIECFSINLSTVQCMQSDVVDFIRRIVNKYCISSSYINFEITESTALASEKQLHILMNELSKEGFSFSMDDYGSGYSNTISVMHFPFATVKLDREMLWSSLKSSKALIIYRNTVNMLRQLDLKICAEGAETDGHIGVLRDMGVDLIQGYYYSKPVPPANFVDEVLRINRSNS